jgi:hypothetical protein
MTFAVPNLNLCNLLFSYDCKQDWMDEKSNHLSRVLFYFYEGQFFSVKTFCV